MGHIVDGTAQGHADTAIVGVANLGNADNLTGHHFSQANLFAFGRQAWDWTLDSEDIAADWVRMTWSNDAGVVDTIVKMMMGSWEALVSYQTPLGVAHQFTSSDHYGPNPSQWFIADDWSPVYYNKADSAGLGFDRSPTGSNFVAQYFPTLEERYGNIDTAPENLLMWFHHVPWDHRMDSGRIFWDELVYRYQMGVQYVTWMRETWDSLEPYIDARRFAEVKAKLATHETDAADWRDTSVNYWQEFSGSARSRSTTARSRPRSWSTASEIGGFDLSAASYTIPVAAGASPRITDVITADPGARYEIVSQADERARAGGRQGHEGRLLRADRQELRLQPGARHDAGEPQRQRHRAGLLQAGRTSATTPCSPPGVDLDPAGRGGRERSRRHRRRRAGDQPHGAGEGHRHQRRRLVRRTR